MIILADSMAHHALYSMYDIWQFLLAFCAGVITMSGAIGAIIKWVNKAKEPGTKLIKRLDEHEQWLNRHNSDIAGINEKIDNDKRSIADIEEGNRVTQKALLAIIDQLLTGNNTDNLKEVKEELQQFLINK